MKMENQYKSEGELFLLFNLTRRPSPHTGGFLMHLTPADWDNGRVVVALIALAEEFGFKLSNFYFDSLMFEAAFPKPYERITKRIKEKPADEDNKLQKKFLENKFSLAHIKKEHEGSLEKAIDYIFGGQESVLEAVSFDINIPGPAKAKIEKCLKDYIAKFINDELSFKKKNFYVFEKHKKIFSDQIKKLQSDHGNEFMISSSALNDERFLFIHCLLAFEQLDYLTLNALCVNEKHWTENEQGHYEAEVALRSSMPTTLYLNGVGDFWREPKEKYCYPMGETSDRHKIVRYLATHNGFQQTSEVSLALEGKDNQLIRKEIGKIRGNIKKFLELDGESVIEMRKGSGYRIGPAYKIVLKD